MMKCIKCGYPEDGSFFEDVCAQCDYEDWMPATGGVSEDYHILGAIGFIIVVVPCIGAIFAIVKLVIDSF